MSRFEIGEEVIVKLQGQLLYRAVVSRISAHIPTNLPEYEVVRDNRCLPLWALDNKDRCIYSAIFPIWRIYKLGEA